MRLLASSSLSLDTSLSMNSNKVSTSFGLDPRSWSNLVVIHFFLFIDLFIYSLSMEEGNQRKEEKK